MSAKPCHVRPQTLQTISGDARSHIEQPWSFHPEKGDDVHCASDQIGVDSEQIGMWDRKRGFQGWNGGLDVPGDHRTETKSLLDNTVDRDDA